jgi:hypothetical protein
MITYLNLQNYSVKVVRSNNFVGLLDCRMQELRKI